MPKPVVHECLTGHEHHVSLPSAQDEIATAGNILTCNCHEVVFVSSFDLVPETELLPVGPPFRSYSTPVSSVIFDAAPDNRDLRGPPVCI